MATNTGPSGTFYRVRIGIGLAAAGALLAACGSSSKAASTGAGGLSTSASTSPSAAASSKDSGSPGSGSTDLGGGSFCDKARKASADEASAAASLASDAPDKIKSFEKNALTELKALKGQAPSEIKGPISTLVDAVSTLYNDLSAANFDSSKVSSQITSQFSSPQFTQAITQIDSYLESKCGINPSAVATS
jgi:hypothetical protein